MNYLEGLNKGQKEAVLHKDGPLLIFAGAGAGKTKTVTHRILHLIQEGVAPTSILAVTFTNKAAGEMRDRVMSLIEKDNVLSFPSSNPWVVRQHLPEISTFHSLGVKILKEHAKDIGKTKNFTILDKDDSLRAIKRILKRLDLDPKQYEPRKILNRISRTKGDGVGFKEFAEGTHDFFGNIVVTVWEKYEKELRETNALDFDDLLVKTLHLLEQNKEILEKYQERWRYIHVDEYQDTNRVQYEFTKLLANKYKNICVVGDNDQSIYSWRGADYSNILNFEKDYPKAKIVLLEENYRSTKTIISAANEVIKKNRERIEKNLFTSRDDGERILVYAAPDEKKEAEFIVGKTKELIDKGTNPKDIAVLYRANFQSRILEEKFLHSGIPYQVLGVRFFERKEIKNMLAYLRAAINPDDLHSIERIINVPARGIGKVTLAKVFGGQRESLSPRMKEKVDTFFEILKSINNKSHVLAPSELLKYVARVSGIEGALKKGSEDDLERLENINELVTLATKYDTLPAEEGLDLFLEDASLMTSDQDQIEDAKGVKLMTVHAAKGLEFDYVFVTGLEEDLFPHTKLGSEEKDEEEERRLFYVAVTRAKEKLFLTYGHKRMLYGQETMNLPSQFIYDIDESLIENQEGAYETVISIE
ncbi:ATP-dependent DNA helicase PcrA [bacterium]|nr:ATP-dependent DNA helicase PcrA [bacterium]|tara:strand:- start:6318 stop:8255 length:1938 start_codon:yes stop_codon:yes gene_type:complete